ncbi:MAG: hypothetical protein AAF388_14435 [Bacteroidota bacterium]
MRVKQSEYKAFVEKMIQQGRDPEAFSFFKKRGLLHIQSQDKQHTFTFFRKKETILNDQKQWEKKETYFLSLPSKATESLSWEEVMVNFEAWLEGV